MTVSIISDSKENKGKNQYHYRIPKYIITLNFRVVVHPINHKSYIGTKHSTNDESINKNYSFHFKYFLSVDIKLATAKKTLFILKYENANSTQNNTKV